MFEVNSTGSGHGEVFVFPCWVSPAGIVVTSSIVAAIARKIGTKANTFHVRLVRLLSVFLTKNIVFGVFLARCGKGRVAFHHANRVDGWTPLVATPAYDKISAIFVTHFQQIGKMRHTVHPFWRQFIVWIVVAPKLFRIIETDKVWVIFEKFFINRKVKIRQLGIPSTCNLYGGPHFVLGASAHPRFGYFVTIFGYLKLAGCCIVAYG